MNRSEVKPCAFSALPERCLMLNPKVEQGSCKAGEWAEIFSENAKRCEPDFERKGNVILKLL